MRSPFRWFRRRSEFAMQAGRRKELEAEFTEFHGSPVRFVPAQAKGGYDQIYYALQGGKRFAVIRVNSPHKSCTDPIGPDDPGVPLGPAERLEREWEAYSRLFPRGLSPEPLWRTHDAIACSWVPWLRASDVLVKRREMTWPIIDHAITAIREMHEAGVIHLDLNTGNFLVEKSSAKVSIIDFEFGPQPWVDVDQQMAFDYLRLLDDFVKPRRGGKIMLGDLGKLEGLLERSVPAGIRQARLGFCLRKLSRLAGQRELCEMLARIFPRLRDES